MMRHLLHVFAVCLLGCSQAQAQKISAKEIAELRAKAEHGDAVSQCNLGERYRHGDGVHTDEAAAMEWFRKSAAQGHARGQFLLGDCHAAQGNHIKARKWYRKAAEQGYAEAQYYLAAHLAENHPEADEDFPEALKWLHAAGEQGNARALAMLGDMHAEGRGVPKDDAEAHKWWALAAKHGSWRGKEMTDKRTELIAAAKEYGCPLAEAEVRLDFRKKVASLRAAAGQRGDVEARFELASILDKRVARKSNTVKDFPYNEDEAEKWYRKAAEGSHAWAQYRLGSIYAERKGDHRSEAEAVKWLLQAADQGHALAQLRVAVMYVSGKGVEKNEAEGVKWVRQAAEGGSMNAQWFLGSMYEEGCGVPKDEAEAVKWYRSSADLGLPKAWCELGYRYANGAGVPKDEAEAAKWLLFAERYHWEDPRETLKSLRENPNAHELLAEGARRMNSYHCSGECPLAEKPDAPDLSRGYLFEEYRRLAKRGDARARFIVHRINDNHAESLKWTSLAANQGLADAQYWFGQFHESGIHENGFEIPKDETQAVLWYRKAALQGQSDALTALDKISASGRISSEDAVDLAKIFRSAAEEGNMRAQIGFARMCLHGRGVAKDASEAMKWFRKVTDRKRDDVQIYAFERGFSVEDCFRAETLFEIGEMYLKGLGVPVNQAEGLKWIMRAVEDKEYLRTRLGRKYEQGEGVPVDRAEAFKWYLLTGKQGNKAANSLKHSASPEEIAEGSKRARDYEEARKAAGKKQEPNSNPAAAK